MCIASNIAWVVTSLTMTATIAWFKSKFIIQILMPTFFNLKDLDIFQWIIELYDDSTTPTSIDPN